MRSLFRTHCEQHNYVGNYQESLVAVNPGNTGIAPSIDPGDWPMGLYWTRSICLIDGHAYFDS